MKVPLWNALSKAVLFEVKEPMIVMEVLLRLALGSLIPVVTKMAEPMDKVNDRNRVYMIAQMVRLMTMRRGWLVNH